MKSARKWGSAAICMGFVVPLCFASCTLGGCVALLLAEKRGKDGGDRCHQCRTEPVIDSFAHMSPSDSKSTGQRQPGEKSAHAAAHTFQRLSRFRQTRSKSTQRGQRLPCTGKAQLGPATQTIYTDTLINKQEKLLYRFRISPLQPVQVHRARTAAARPCTFCPAPIKQNNDNE